MNVWSFHQPVRLRFTPGGWVDEAAAFAARSPLLFVTSPGGLRRGYLEALSTRVPSRVQAAVVDRPNPDWADVLRIYGGLNRVPATRVIAVGGGSVLDAAKALAVLMETEDPGALERHLVDGGPAPDAARPLCAVPTTAGTGSEVTATATLWDRERGLKHALAGSAVYPAVAVLDAHLTRSLPLRDTVSSGLDALSHALESAWNRHANPVSLAFAAAATRTILRVLPQLVTRLDDLALRSAMLEAATLAGLAIGITRSALAHSISYPLTLEHDLPHGVACSFTLPEVLRFNSEHDSEPLDEFARSAGCAGAGDLANAVAGVLRAVDAGAILREHIPSREAALSLAPRMISPGRAGNNLRAAATDDAAAIVAASWDRLIP